MDVVDVCTHSRGRMAVAMTAFEKGVHCMVEKPMARTWIEADRAARACADHPEVLLQLNDDNAFDPKYHAYRDLIRQGAIGKVQHVSLIRGSDTDATTVLKSQASALYNGGGCLMDYGSQGIAGVWSVLGLNMRPVRVEAVRIGVRFPHRVLEGEPVRLEVEDDAHVKILFEDPETGEWVTVFLEATWSGGEWRCRHWRIDREHSNACTAWLDMGRPNLPDEGQLRRLQERQGLETAEPEFTVSDGPAGPAGRNAAAFSLPLGTQSCLRAGAETGLVVGCFSGRVVHCCLNPSSG